MLCSTTAASAAATITPESMVWSRPPISSSSVKVTAAIGALKAAAMPAAMPTEVIRRLFSGLSRATRARILLTPAQICTVGPSTPSDAPRPKLQRAQNKLADRLLQRDGAEAEGVRRLHLGNAAARRRRNPIVSPSPTTSPPSAGVRIVHQIHAWPGARAARSMSNAVKPGATDVKCHRRQPAQSAGQNREGQQPLPLVGHAAHQATRKSARTAPQCQPNISIQGDLAAKNLALPV